MKRILIIGASVLQLPAIQKAKDMGLYVGVIDFNPEAIGIPFADKYFNVSTIDEEGVYQAAKEFQADGIITLATDMPIRSVAYATHKLGLIGITYESAIKATDKGEMIKAFAAADVEHPWYYLVSDIDDLNYVIDKVTYPCISKPVDSAGSRGVVLINSKAELQKAILYSSSKGRNGGVIIEEYLQGREVSVEAMVIDREVHILQVTDKLTTGAPHFVEMGHSQPCGLGEKNVKRIHDLAKRAIKAIGINNGPAHVEIMLTENGPKMIELGARLGGDCITTHLVPLSTGIDMVKATIEMALGEIPDITPKFQKGSAIRYFDEIHGMIQSVSGIEDAKKIEGIRQITIVKKTGDLVGEIGSSVDRIGYVIAQSETAEGAVTVCHEAMKMIEIMVR